MLNETIPAMINEFWQTEALNLLQYYGMFIL